MLFVANTINIGADLGAMADVVKLLAGGPHLLYVLVFGAFCATLQIFLQYTRYVAVLKWLTLALFAYFGTVMAVKIPWYEAVRGFLIPTFKADLMFWTTVVAILGTTISPYLFFWQASQEAEDTKEEPRRKPLVKAPRQARDALERIRLDTYVGMAFSNLVALAIMVTTAATLHVAGVHNVESSAQAAEALKPVAGEFAFAIFALGIIGTGLLAVPVLAGSAAYAIGEARKWPIGGAAAQESQSFLSRNRIGDIARCTRQFLTDRSDKGAVLECRAQWHCRCSGDGDDDADQRQSPDHGQVHRGDRDAGRWLDGHRGHGYGCGRNGRNCPRAVRLIAATATLASDGDHICRRAPQLALPHHARRQHRSNNRRD